MKSLFSICKPGASSICIYRKFVLRKGLLLGQIKLVSIANRTFFTYTLSPDEVLDQATLGMLENNIICGLLPVHFLQKDDQRILKYDITQMLAFADFLQGDRDGMKLVLAFKSMADAILDAQEYMIEERSFLFGMDTVYIGQDGTGQLVCLPVEKKQGEGFAQFCMQTVQQQAVARHLKNGPLASIYTYLCGKAFSVKEFSSLLGQVELQSAIAPGQSAKQGSQPVEPVILSGRKQTGAKKQEPVILSGKGLKNRQNIQDPVGHRDGKPAKKQKPQGPVILSGSGRVQQPLPKGQETRQGSAGAGQAQGCLYRVATREKIAVTKAVFRIGKSREGNDACIQGNHSVSRHHAVIIQQEGYFYIVDTGSLNHTYIGGKRIPVKQPVPLSNGMKISLSDEKFIFLTE